MPTKSKRRPSRIGADKPWNEDEEFFRAGEPLTREMAEKALAIQDTKKLQSLVKSTQTPSDLLLRIILTDPQTYAYFFRLNPRHMAAIREEPRLLSAITPSLFEVWVEEAHNGGQVEALLGEPIETLTFTQIKQDLRAHPNQRAKELIEYWPDYVKLYPSGAIEWIRAWDGENMDPKFGQTPEALLDILQLEMENVWFFYASKMNVETWDNLKRYADKAPRSRRR